MITASRAFAYEVTTPPAFAYEPVRHMPQNGRDHGVLVSEDDDHGRLVSKGAQASFPSYYEMVTQSIHLNALRKIAVYSVAEWRKAGLTESQFRSQVRSGALVQVRYGVYATKGAADWGRASPKRRHALLAMAACAAVGRDSVISHQSAAVIHSLDLFQHAADIVVLTRPASRRSSRLPSTALLFHTAALPDDHVTKLLGMRVTAVPRTVVDIARTSSFMAAVVTADSALRAGDTTKEGLVSICDTCAGWPGIRQARRVVEFSDPRAESVLESCARVIFHEQGLAPPDLQFSITGPDFRYSVDFYWPEFGVAAEADGAVKYAEPRTAIRQLERDQRLRDLGYKVIHFTWRELFRNPEGVVGRIRKAFAAPSAI